MTLWEMRDDNCESTLVDGHTCLSKLAVESVLVLVVSVAILGQTPNHSLDLWKVTRET